jgi:hypothetical protein
MASDPPKVLISYSSFYWYPVFFRGFGYTATASKTVLHSFLVLAIRASSRLFTLAHFSKPVTSTTRHFRL